VPVLSNVAVIGKSGEAGSFKPEVSAASAPVASPPSEAAAKGAAPLTPQPEIAFAPVDTRIRISPRAKRLAEDKGLITGIWQVPDQNGRIITSDIEKIKTGGAVNLCFISGWRSGFYRTSAQ